MQTLDTLHTSALHHAYMVVGEPAATYTALAHAIEKAFGMPIAGNPDVYYSTHDSFGIDDARHLKEQHATRPVQYERRVFIIAARALTHEAQNALLKIFEEPAPSSVFFLLTPEVRNMLPTLRSRVVELYPDAEKSAEPEREDARAFLAAEYGARLKQLSPIISEKDFNRARILLNNLEYQLSGYAQSEPTRLAGLADAFGTIYFVRRYLSGRAPAVKMLMEYLALALPVIKKEG